MGKTALLSESHTAQILRRYNAATVIGLLREVAKCDKARVDWDVLAKKLSAGIGSARECQALWRHIAYRKELADSFAEDEQPSEDESDLEFELLPTPAVSSEANAEVVRWVKADMQRFDIGGGKKKGESKSKSRDAGLLADSNQGLSRSGRDGGQKGAANGAGDPSTVSPPSGAPGLANPECTVSRATLGQSERKKRKLWSQEEDQELISAVEKFGEGYWTLILKGSFTHERTAAQLSQRWALIRKRREAGQVVANRPVSSPPAEQGNGVPTPPADQGLQTNPLQNGTHPLQNGNAVQNGNHVQNVTHASQNGGNSASVSTIVPPTSVVGNGCVDDAMAPNTAMALSSGCQSRDHASSPPNVPPNSRVNGTPNGAVATSGCMDSVALKGGVETLTKAVVTNGGQRQASAGGTGGAARSTAGSSTAVAALALGQVRSASAKSTSASVGAGRLIAPGAVVMSAAAAQAASVGVGETRQAATLPSTGAMTSGQMKYVVRSNGRGVSLKALTGPDPGVQAAAVAAGARIAPVSTLLKGAHPGNVVHIRPGGLPTTKSGLPNQSGMGHSGSGGSRGASGAIVHYITTQRPPQTKNQAAKTNGSSLITSVAASGSSQVSTIAPNGSSHMTSVAANGSSRISSVTPNGSTQTSNVTPNGSSQTSSVVPNGSSQTCTVAATGSSHMSSIVANGSSQTNSVTPNGSSKIAPNGSTSPTK